jgi:hypothetical protein
MVMPPQGTFDYVAVVPATIGAGGFDCRATMRDSGETTDDDFSAMRLVGPSPIVRIADAGLTPDANARRPWVERSRISLAAASRRLAGVAEASFHVDKVLTARLRPGDELNLVRTASGGLGLSVVRGGELIVAVGAIPAVRLGRTVSARVPGDLVTRAAAIFRERDPGFCFAEEPIEIAVDAYRKVMYGGRCTIGDYGVFVVHGWVDGIPGTDACAAIYRNGAFPCEAGDASAMLMDCADALSMTRWDEPALD